jgi:hypothetical protein
MWPGYIGVMPQNGGGIPLGVLLQGRPGGNALGTHSQTVAGTGTIAAATGTGFNGRGGIQASPGAAGSAKIGIDWALNPAIGAAAVNKYRSDPFSCFRMLGVLAFGANNGAGETGWVYVASNAGDDRLRDGGATGFGFVQTGVGQVSFIRRAGSGGGGGALTSVPVLNTDAAGLVSWHLYEIRVIGATDTANAKVRVYVDGIPVAAIGTLDWVNDNLPVPVANGGAGSYGLTHKIYSYAAAAGAGGIIVHRTFFHAAPTEDALL